MPPSNSKPTFYTVFSNSPKAEDFLPNLSEEAGKIADHLNGLAFTDMIYYMKDELFSAERLIDTFTKYGEKFTIFYFSGHAKNGSLKLSDNFITNVDKMAALINNLRGLKLAFFNACETFDLAKAIVKKRLKSKNPTRLELIACGREVNTFAAEHFGHKFIIHAGREGTFYDAYSHARDLVAFTNDQVVFREFTTLDELESAKGDFDFAYIDIDPEKITAAPIAPPAAAAVSPKASALVAAGAAQVLAPAAPAAVASSSEVPPATPETPEIKMAPSMLKIDKKTDDILAANYLRECIQMMISSGNLKPEEVALLNDAVEKAKQVADGANITSKIKEVWEQAAKMLPGVNAENDFKALAKVSKESYNRALDQFYGKTDNRPVVENIMVVTEKSQTAQESTKESKAEPRDKKEPVQEPVH